MHLSRRVLRPLLVGAVLALLSVAVSPASAAFESSAATRPTATIVKRGLTKTWDLDRENSVDKVTLTFKNVKLMQTRRAVPARDFVEPNAWVTPVAVTFDQKIVTLSPNILTGKTDRYCLIYRVNFTGIFWKGDFGWSYKNRDIKTRRVADSC
jgi:hypothetical protein